MLADLSFLSLIWAVSEVAGIIVALDAIMHGRTSEGAIAWAISLVFLPPLVIPIYLIFGSHKFRGYVRARRSTVPKISQTTQALVQRLSCGQMLADAAPSPLCRGVWEKLAILPLTQGNRAELLVGGQTTFASIFQAIASASDYILFQSYLVRDDRIGHRLKSELSRKAAQGIRIFFLYDDIGSYALGDDYIRSLKAAGIQVFGFNANKRRKNRFQLNFRNHRKIVVVDGRTAFVGGLNIGDEYLGRDRRLGPWRDTHSRIRGPAVFGVQLAFVEDWFWATGEFPDLNWTDADAEKDGGYPMMVVASGPADTLETCSLFFVNAIHAARRRLWIASPYFAPDRPVISALQSAALRGVDVRIMLPARADLFLVHLASYAYIQEVGSAGVKFYRYRPAILHQKVMLIDDRFATVGTANLDNRSFRINFEITVLVDDTGFAGSVRDMLEKDFSMCERLSVSDLLQRPAWFRLATRTIRLLSPVL